MPIVLGKRVTKYVGVCFSYNAHIILTLLTGFMSATRNVNVTEDVEIVQPRMVYN